MPSLSTQGAGASGIEALSYSLAVVEKVAGPVDGILGHNFFQRFNFLLDIEHRQLWIDPDAQFSGGKVAFTLAEGRIQIPVSLHSDDPEQNLTLDSGASHLVLFSTVNLKQIRTVLLNTVTGSRPVAMGMLPQPPFSTSGGLLPVHLFRSVYFNHTGGYVIFNLILTTQSQANEVYFQATGSCAKP